MKILLILILALVGSTLRAQTTNININVNITTVIKIDTNKKNTASQVWVPHTPMAKPMIDYHVFNKLPRDHKERVLKIFYELIDEYRIEEYSYLHTEDGRVIESKIHHKLYPSNKNWIQVIVDGRKIAIPQAFSIEFKTLSGEYFR